MPRPSRVFLPAMLLLLLSSTTLRAQASADPSGHWAGTVKVPSGDVDLIFDLAKNARGELTGTFTDPRGNAKGLPLASVAVDGQTVRFLIKGNAGGTFQGVLTANRRAIEGDFTTADGAHTLPFTMTRTGDAQIELAAKSPPVGKELEGRWSGTLEAKGRQVRLVLTMANLPDGSATATILNADEDLEVPVTRIAQQSARVTLELKAVGGRYSATLNAEGTALVGTWSEGSATLPLTFRRATPR